MRSTVQQIAFLVILLGTSTTAQGARAGEVPCLMNQTPSAAGSDDSAKPVCSDAGSGQRPELLPADSQLAAATAGLADVGDATTHQDVESEAKEKVAPISRPTNAAIAAKKDVPPDHVANLTFGGARSQQNEDLPVVIVPAPKPSSKRLPVFGVMADVGLPDGLIGSLTIRPWSWVRFSAGGGTNFISGGWRAGITLLPLGAGPSASFEYGRYQDGNANPMAKRFGLGDSPALERFGYQYMNAHLGLDFGFRRCVFFIHGGITMLRGQIHNLGASIPAPNTNNLSTSGTTEVVVPQDPSAKAVGPSLKLGLIVYIR
jgi:hypothetical protein